MYKKCPKQSKSVHIRASPSFIDTINFIKVKYRMSGKKPPTTRRITEIMANKINKEELYHEFYLRL